MLAGGILGKEGIDGNTLAGVGVGADDGAIACRWMEGIVDGTLDKGFDTTGVVGVSADWIAR